MSLLQEEREIILNNGLVDTFDFAEVKEFVKYASKDLFISHPFKKKAKDKILVQPRGGFPTYEIESVVAKNIPQIEQCAVFGIDNEQIEEEIIMVYSASSKIPKKRFYSS